MSQPELHSGEANEVTNEMTNIFFPLHHIDRVHVLEDRSLVLENVNLSDEGEYRCEAENVVGSISAVGSLIIQCMYKFPMLLNTFCSTLF